MTPTKTQQLITDMFVKTTQGRVIKTSNRSNSVHIQNGASCSLLAEGELLSRYASNIDISEGDGVNVLDYMGSVIVSGTIIGKMQRVWDMSLPPGQRMVYCDKSPNYDECNEKYNKR